MKPLYKPQELIAWMDANQVDCAWVSIPPPLYRPHLQGEQAQAWAHYVNAGIEQIAQASGGRLGFLPFLPINAPDVAEKVAQEWAARGQNRFSASTTGSGEQVLSDPAYDGLWRALHEAKAFVFFHPGECADGRLKAFYLSNLIGNPYETAVAIGHVVFGGVLDRYPDISFCFAHGGGAAPMLAGRFQHGFDTNRPGIDTSRPAPRSALKRICVDCITHDADALELAEKVFGPSQIVFGSDWPFPLGLMKPHDQLANVGANRRKRIFCDNVDELLAR